jgi:hypothetical protein
VARSRIASSLGRDTAEPGYSGDQSDDDIFGPPPLSGTGREGGGTADDRSVVMPRRQ